MFEADDRYTYKMGGSTFLIRIHFKQNVNWQGTIQWLEENKTVHFRSVLELMYLLNEAVDKSSTTGELDFRSWENTVPENFSLRIKSIQEGIDNEEKENGETQNKYL